MSVYLSASAIKDYLSCKQRYYYRRYFPEQSVTTDAMFIGSAVHDILEKHWDSKSNAFFYHNTEYAGIDPANHNKISDFIENYFKYFRAFNTDSDEIEKYFKVYLKKDVYLVGKYDRIVHTSNLIIDWKTSKYTPKTLENDIQFIMYHKAFIMEYNKYPIIAYANLSSGNVKYYKPNEFYSDLLFKTVIPNMLKDIKKENYYRDGLFKYKTCDWCPFKDYCFSEMSNELVCGDPSNL